MRNFFSALALSIFSIPASAGTLDVNAFVDQWEKAEVKEDYLAISNLLHPHAVYRVNDADYVGKEAIIASMKGTAEGASNQSYVTHSRKIVFENGESGAVAFQWDWTGATPENVPFRISGRGSMMISVHEQKPRLVLLHLSRDETHVGIELDQEKIEPALGEYASTTNERIELYVSNSKLHVRDRRTGLDSELFRISQDQFRVYSNPEAEYWLKNDKVWTLNSVTADRSTLFSKVSTQ
jgi:Domain of unknown function (DUF4440)